ncbi:MAG: hypothetical protein U0Y82_10925 [Thermoleophilia bacterium]
MSVRVRPWRAQDAPAVAALSARLAAPDPGWTPAQAASRLTGDVYAHGRDVAVAVRDEEVVGLLAAVTAPPWMFVWPMWTDHRPAADALLEWAVALARTHGVTGMRMSCPPHQAVKLEAITALGFVHTDDFLRVVRSVDREPDPGPPPPGTRWTGVGRGEREVFRRIYNDVFEGHPHSVPISGDDLDGLMDGDEAWPGATGMLRDGAGRPTAFVFGLRTDAGGTVEGIGTVRQARGRGLARWMLLRTLAVAAAEGMGEVEALILSSNAASLALHRGRGFRDTDRKPMYELRVPAP